jgi:hypothetical protein
MLCDTHPRSAWHEWQISDAGWVLLPDPINAVVQPHSQGSGKHTVTPRIGSNAALLSATCASTVACAAAAVRVFLRGKSWLPRASRSDATPGRLFVSYVATPGRRQTQKYSADGIDITAGAPYSEGYRLFFKPSLNIRPIEVETAIDALGGRKSALRPMAPTP